MDFSKHCLRSFFRLVGRLLSQLVDRSFVIDCIESRVDYCRFSVHKHTLCTPKTTMCVDIYLNMHKASMAHRVEVPSALCIKLHTATRVDIHFGRQYSVVLVYEYKLQFATSTIPNTCIARRHGTHAHFAVENTPN